jgi:hypothetical protein
VEDTRFDEMSKVLGSLKTRRLTLGALFGGALSALGMAEGEAKKKNNKKNKKKKCLKTAGPCETCNNKGKKKPKANGTACTPPGGTAGQCANAVCIATSAPVPPAPPSPVCVTQGNPCVQGGTGTAACCAGTVCGRAFGATAGTFNCCNGPGTQCSAATASQCCSGGCNTNTAPPTCVCKTSGTACDDNSQCCSNRCLSGTCAAAQSARG